MKIQSVEAIPVAYPEPNDFGATRHLCLVRLISDDGRIGWGEAVTTWEEATAATCKVIEGLGPHVLGRDPIQSEAIWQTLREHTWWYGRGGIASFALSAIDIAVWDLKGKAYDQPLINLLGGPVHERLPAIISAHPNKTDIREMAEEVGEWLASGLHGYKFGMGKKGYADLGHDRERDVAFVRALREAIGQKKDIMVDVGSAIRWDVATAVDRTKAFEEWGIRWVEEPLDPTDLEGYRTLRTKIDTLIASGEREWHVTGYENLLRAEVIDVVGVDPGRVEGITACCKIVERIEAGRRHFNAHAWSSAIISATSLALSAATSAALVFEVKPLRNPMQHELVSDPIDHEGGWISPPQSPGLGVEVLEDVVEHYRVDR
jgi:L-alanine-DL-glutamate epimerase-like enolase superfamily enzyme